jgi:hypothetical protein
MVALGERLLVEGTSHRLLVLTALVIVIGIVGSFVILAGLMYSFKSLGLFFYVFVAMAIFSAFAAYSVYVGFRRRNWAFLAVMFTTIGVFVFASSTVAALPYSTVQTYPTQSSQHIFDETFSIGPNETRSFEKYLCWIQANSSLVQVRMTSTSQQLYVQLNVAEKEGLPSIGVLNFTYSGYGHQYGFDWHSHFWTPSTGVYENGPYVYVDYWNYISVSLHNLDSSQAEVQMQTDIFYKTDGHVETVEYRPLIDFRFAYAGIGLIGMALFAEGYPQLSKKKQ